MSKTFSGFGALIAAGILLGPLYAAPTPIPTSLLGNHYVTFPNSNSFPSSNLIGPYPAGYGGAFQADVYASPTSATGNPTLTTVWCVDYQLDVQVGAHYTADITSLNNITTPTDPSVRYGNIDSSTVPPNWSNALTPVNAFGYDTNSSQYRYALTAALVSEYDNTNSQIQPQNPDNDARNQAIQTAIWYITYNTESNPSASWSALVATAGAVNHWNISSGVPGGYNNWVQWAEANVTSVDLSAWAVVSGPVVNGTLGSATNGVYQTFLVQVQPEPAFYGLLGLGLAGLFVAGRRRKVNG